MAKDQRRSKDQNKRRVQERHSERDNPVQHRRHDRNKVYGRDGNATEDMEGATEYIGGRNPVLEALRSGRTVDTIYLAAGLRESGVRELLRLARERGAVVQEVPRPKLDDLLGGANHQGVVARISPYAYWELDDLLARVGQGGNPPFLLLLDGIEDPHNLGAVLRTGDAVGVDGVIIPKRRSVGVTPTVVKVSTGAVEHVPVVRVNNMVRCIETLQGHGIWVVGSDAAAEQLYTEVDYDGPVALVIGGEGKGLSRLVREKVDFLVRLPMVGHVNSLNAAVAASVLMYEVLRQRRQEGR